MERWPRTRRKARIRNGGFLLARCALGLGLLLSAPAAGVEFWSSEDGERSFSFETALKWSSLLSSDRVAEDWSTANLWRLRMGLEAEPNDWMSAELAYEHRSLGVLGGEGSRTGSGLFPSDAEAPYRICQLDWPIVEIIEIEESGEGRMTYSYRHELDRASVAFHPDWGELTLGRQAIGWGRGVIFSAVDIFAPFSPMEVDREWRRGIDAVRLDVSLSDTFSMDIVGAFGDEFDWDESALVGRVRGYAGQVDAELIFGKRAEDLIYAGTTSAAVGDAELHCELAVFDVPEEPPGGGLFGSDRLVGKAVFGGSYNFDVGNGLTVFMEYHYSGFGVKDVKGAADPGFQERYLRGDTQILGQHALALQATYRLSDTWSSSLLWLQSLADGSGLIAPGLTWDFAENVSLVCSAYFPYGAPPENGELKSEYGAAPTSGFLQIRLYY